MYRGAERLVETFLATMLATALVLSLSAVPAFANGGYSATAANLGASMVAQAKAKSGWNKSHTAYYRKGAKVTGLQKIGKSRYFFTARGALKKSDFSAGGVRFYVNDDGTLIGAKSGGKYYYNTLKPMSSVDAYDFKTYIRARSIVSGISNAGDSAATKLWKAFNWVKGKSYAIHQNFDPRQTNWTAIYANYHFDNRGGDCHSDGAAFAYLAAAIGYPADVCIDSWGTGHAPSHCWTMIGNRVYDPLFYESKGSMYYGATSGTYETSPTARFRVPQFNPKNAKAGSKASSKLASAGYVGLKKVGKYYYFFKNGKKVKHAWKTVGGKRYYFKANGRAATLSTKIKGTYYVFDKKGALQNSKKAGNRLVTVGGETYRVNQAGKAVAGWSADGTQRFDASGLLLKGTWFVDGAFYAASATGVYDASKTAALNEAAKRGSSAAALKALLGAPGQQVYSKSCNIDGDDGIWVYDHFMVTTARPADTAVQEYVWSVEAR